MQNNLKGSDLLKKLILSRYNTLGELANKLQIDISTLSRKIKKPSRAFLIQLKSHKVPVPDDMINPNVEKIKVFIDEDGSQPFRINEPGIDYNDIELLIHTVKKLQVENLNLKAENYDLKKQLEGLKNANR